MLQTPKVSQENNGKAPVLHGHPSLEAKHVSFGIMPVNMLPVHNCKAVVRNSRRRSRVLIANVKISSGDETIVKETADTKRDIGILTVHHVGLLCENLERLLEFHENILGLEMFAFG